MILALQILFVLALMVVIILFALRPKKVRRFQWPEHYSPLLEDYVPFYSRLGDEDRRRFENRMEKFLSSVKITGVNAEVDDLDRVLIAAAAIMPVFYILDWDYLNLREVLLYPGHFTSEFEQHGHERNIAGMVGSGPLQHMMILSKWELREGFINRNSSRNTALHEFVHLIDKMDGSLDGIPGLLLERRYHSQWQREIDNTIEAIRQGRSEIDSYAATGPVECFAVVSEYFFEQPETFASRQPQWNQLLRMVYRHP